MREARAFAVYGFASTHDALAAEDALQEGGVPVTPIPAPKALGAKCGIALRVALEDSERAEHFLSAARMSWTGRSDVQDV